MPVSTLPELSHAELNAELTFARSTSIRSNSIPQPEACRARPAYVRRRGSSEQGHALETLGHAVEYLVDSRMLCSDPHTAAGEREAIEILMRLNRAVFSECPEIVPFGCRIRQWFAARVLRL